MSYHGILLPDVFVELWQCAEDIYPLLVLYGLIDWLFLGMESSTWEFSGLFFAYKVKDDSFQQSKE